jgi:hypothetical protein
VYCGWSSRTEAQPTYATDVQYTSGFSCPNPIFCPSIPIPIPTPTPTPTAIIMPAAIGTRSGCRPLPGVWAFFNRLAQARLSRRLEPVVGRLLLVPIGVGVGNRDRDRFRQCIVVGPHARWCLVARVLSATMAVQQGPTGRVPCIRFSCPNPIFYPSIPIPIPTPTPMIIPAAIGTRSGCRPLPGGVWAFFNRLAQARLSRRLEPVVGRLLLVPIGVGVGNRDRDRFRLCIVVYPHARCSLVARFSSATQRCGPARP